MKFTKLIICLLLTSFLISCGAKKRAAKRESRAKTEYPSEKNNPKIYPYEEEVAKTEEEPVRKPEPPKKESASITEIYIYKYAPIAKEEMELYGIPASITLAQGILESGSGYGELCLKSNNHFGIKCKDWEGGKVYHDDDKKGECFRKYKDPKYSFRDHSLFLTNRGRYAFLFDLDQDDYKGWARGLKKAGYATDPKYPDKLISLIHRYDLTRFDNQVLGNSNRNKSRNDKVSGRTYTVRDGDNLYSISKRFDLSVKELKKMNNLRGDIIEIGQELYVER
jgi:flagellum-specific peptidoglycan hydrolase FlgJ